MDAIWLSPFYPSPNADFGYDVTDYTDVDPAYGTLEDFDELVAAAHERELKVLVDFVPAHTSIEHPWFRERPDFYFWADAAAEQLAGHLRRHRRGSATGHRPLLPALVLSRAGRPELAQSRACGRR